MHGTGDEWGLVLPHRDVEGLALRRRDELVGHEAQPCLAIYLAGRELNETGARVRAHVGHAQVFEKVELEDMERVAGVQRGGRDRDQIDDDV